MAKTMTCVSRVVKLPCVKTQKPLPPYRSVETSLPGERPKVRCVVTPLVGATIPSGEKPVQRYHRVAATHRQPLQQHRLLRAMKKLSAKVSYFYIGSVVTRAQKQLKL